MVIFECLFFGFWVPINSEKYRPFVLATTDLASILERILSARGDGDL